MEGYVNLDKDNADIMHNLEQTPYPFDSDYFEEINASHIIEHLKPWLMIDIMNELWRIAQNGAKLIIETPYGVNELYVADPTHCNPCNEHTWQYFDPDFGSYDIYKPQPWKIIKGELTRNAKCLLVVMQKRR